MAGVLLLAAVIGGGCEREDWKPDVLASASVHPDLVVLEKGRETYATYCVGCHGEAGDGAGPAARFLDPKPRDFRLGLIKFAGVESGQLPYDEDYERVIREGLHGSSMPAWRFMPEDDVQAVTQYIKTFAADVFANDTPHARIFATEDPWVGREDKAVAEGAVVYHALARCNNCHPSYLTRQEIHDVSKEKFGYGISSFREDMYAGAVSENDWGHEIIAPDFLDYELRNGAEPDALYRVITSGVGGTAMPTWRGALPEENLWSLVHYIRSLVLAQETLEAEALRKRLAEQPELVLPSAKAAENDEEGEES